MFPESDPEEHLERELTPSDLLNAKISMWALAAFIIILALYLPGCVSAPIAPNLKLPEQSCSKLDMPAVPQKVFLKIDGDKIEADDGGDMLFRGYVRARYLLR